MLFSKVEKLLMDISESINRQDSQQLLKLLKSRVSPFKGVYDENAEWYMAQLTQEKESQLVSFAQAKRLVKFFNFEQINFFIRLLKILIFSL